MAGVFGALLDPKPKKTTVKKVQKGKSNKRRSDVLLNDTDLLQSRIDSRDDFDKIARGEKYSFGWK